MNVYLTPQALSIYPLCLYGVSLHTNTTLHLNKELGTSYCIRVHVSTYNNNCTENIYIDTWTYVEVLVAFLLSVCHQKLSFLLDLSLFLLSKFPFSELRYEHVLVKVNKVRHNTVKYSTCICRVNCCILYISRCMRTHLQHTELHHYNVQREKRLVWKWNIEMAQKTSRQD